MVFVVAANMPATTTPPAPSPSAPLSTLSVPNGPILLTNKHI